MSDRLQLWWLSFVGDGFLGVSIVLAVDFITAVTTAHMLGINPGGEVKGHPWSGEKSVPDSYVGRLLSTAELDELMEVIGSRRCTPEEVDQVFGKGEEI